MIVPMSIVTRPRTPVPAVPEPGSAQEPSPAPDSPSAPRPGGDDRRRRVRRRRATLAGAVLSALIAIFAALTLTGSGDVPPATEAARVVPADVLAYVHLSTDASRPAVGWAKTLAARFPDYPLAYAAAISRLSAIVGGSSSVDFATGLRPWLGKEAALHRCSCSTCRAARGRSGS